MNLWYNKGMIKEFKLIVAGSRGFNDYKLLKNKLDFFLKKQTNISIISGTAKGADKLGERYAREKDYDLIQLPAEWDKYGKKAGYLRNVEMANIADAVVLFWDGKSNGTKHMLDIAKEKELMIRVIYY